MGIALEGGEGGKGGKRNAKGWGGGGVQWSKTPRIWEGPKVCRVLYSERFVFESWLIRAFELLINGIATIKAF